MEHNGAGKTTTIRILLGLMKPSAGSASVLGVLFSPETYYAALLAFVVFTFAVFPAAIFMYRPDVFQDHAALRDFIAFPRNLLRLSDSLLRITPVILLVAAVIILLLLAVGGRRLKRIDIV